LLVREKLKDTETTKTDRQKERYSRRMIEIEEHIKKKSLIDRNKEIKTDRNKEKDRKDRKSRKRLN